MRISDWSSDVCSSDLRRAGARRHRRAGPRRDCGGAGGSGHHRAAQGYSARAPAGARGDRKSVVEGKRVSVRVELGGWRISKKNKVYNLMISRMIIVA